LRNGRTGEIHHLGTFATVETEAELANNKPFGRVHLAGMSELNVNYQN
jgi:hypothetical protein